LLAVQFPFVNTGKPLVNNITMQKPNANGVEYTGNTLADEFEDEI